MMTWNINLKILIFGFIMTIHWNTRYHTVTIRTTTTHNANLWMDVSISSTCWMLTKIFQSLEELLFCIVQTLLCDNNKNLVLNCSCLTCKDIPPTTAVSHVRMHPQPQLQLSHKQGHTLNYSCLMHPLLQLSHTQECKQTWINFRIYKSIRT